MSEDRKTATTIQEEILACFNELDRLSSKVNGQAFGTEKPSTSINVASLVQLSSVLEDLEDDLDFLEEKKEVISEVLEIVENDYESLDINKKEVILGYIKTSNTGVIDPDIRSLAGEIEKNDLRSITKDAYDGLDSFIGKATTQIEKIKNDIEEEEKRFDEVQKDELVRHLEYRDRQVEDEESKEKENEDKFLELIQRLDILIEELEISLGEENQNEELSKLRSFINQETKDFA